MTMDTDGAKNNEDRFEELVREANFLGAWVVLKSSKFEKTAEGVLLGSLANALQNAVSIARQKDDREKAQYYRSILSWVLRDFPGLASLYREQTRPTSSLIPESLAPLWNSVSDLLSGRKGMEEEIRERMDDVVRVVRETSPDGEVFAQVIRETEDNLRKGFATVQDAMNGFSSAPDQNPKTPEKIIKVNIRDADEA